MAPDSDYGEQGQLVQPAQPANEAPPPPPTPRMMIQQALDQLHHPGNLDLTGRLHAIETLVRTMAMHLMGRE